MTVALYWHLIRLRLRERMEYRGAFLIGLACQGLAYVADFVVIWVLVHAFGTLAGWRWHEIAMLYAMNLLTYAIGAAFTYSQTELESLVTRGTFDVFLVKPTNPLLTFSAHRFNVGYVGHVVIACAVMAWSLTRHDYGWDVPRWLFFVTSVVSGSLLQAAIMLVLGAVAFLVVRATYLFGLHGNIRSFITYPLSIYGVVVQLMLTVIIPFAFVNFLPLTVLMGKDTGALPAWIGWLTPLVGPAVFAIAWRIWFAGVNRYQGGGG